MVNSVVISNMRLPLLKPVQILHKFNTQHVGNSDKLRTKIKTKFSSNQDDVADMEHYSLKTLKKCKTAWGAYILL